MAQTLDSLVVELKADIKGLQASLRTATGEIQAFERNAGRTGKAVEQGLTGATKNAGILAGALGGLRSPILGIGAAWATVDIGRQFFDAGTKLTALQNQMIAATGDVKTGAAAMAFARAEANRLGQDLLITGDGFAKLATATLRSGLSMEQTQRIFSGVTEAATALHISSDRVGLVFTALSQMANKQKVSWEELGGQLGESLPGALAIFAASMGKTTPEFLKMVSAGEVLVPDLVKLGDTMHEQFGVRAVASAQTARAELNRFNNATLELKGTVANGGFMEALATAFKTATEAINTPALRDGLTVIGQVLGGVAIIASRVVAGLAIMIEKVVELGKKAAEANSGVSAASRARGVVVNPDRPSAPVLNGKQTSFMPEMLPGNDMTASLDTGTMSDASMTGAAVPAGGFGGGEGPQSVMETALALRQSYADAVVGIEADKNSRLQAQDQEYWSSAQSELEGFLGIRLRTQEQINADSVADQAQTFRTTLQQAANHNKAFFVMEKAAAIARALVSARESVVSAYNWGMRMGGPPLAFAFAGVAAAAQAANIAAIASTSFGGSSGGGMSSSGGGYSSSGENQPADNLGRPLRPATQVYITIEGGDRAEFNGGQVRRLIEQINDAQKNGSRVEVYAA